MTSGQGEQEPFFLDTKRLICYKYKIDYVKSVDFGTLNGRRIKSSSEKLYQTGIRFGKVPDVEKQQFFAF